MVSIVIMIIKIAHTMIHDHSNTVAIVQQHTCRVIAMYNYILQ